MTRQTNMSTALVLLTALAAPGSAAGYGDASIMEIRDGGQVGAQSCIQKEDRRNLDKEVIDSSRLEVCDGVLEPAPSVDPDIVIREPDPDTGTMPVIPPQALPDNPEG